MSNTEKTWTQDQPFTDGQLFIGASQFLPLVVAGAPAASAGAGLFTRNVPASTTVNLFASITALLRTGQYANGPLTGGGSQAFGTAAAVPGPSSVSGTSNPRAFIVSPPIKAASLPTLQTGQMSGPVLKGFQITSVDVIYEVDTGAITSATIGVTATAFPLPAASGAPTVTNIIALAANGLPTAANTAGQATTTRVTVTTPAFIVTAESEVIVNVNFVSPASNTVKFYGVILNTSTNYN